QKQIRSSENRLGFRPRASNKADRADVSLPRAVEGVEQRLSLEPKSLHPLEEDGKNAGILLGIADRSELLQPVDLAPQAEEPLDVLHVHPNVPAAVREVGDLVNGDHRSHFASSATEVQVASADKSRKPMRRISLSRSAWCTRWSHSVRSSSSRS